MKNRNNMKDWTDGRNVLIWKEIKNQVQKVKGCKILLLFRVKVVVRIFNSALRTLTYSQHLYNEQNETIDTS